MAQINKTTFKDANNTYEHSDELFDAIIDNSNDLDFRAPLFSFPTAGGGISSYATRVAIRMGDFVLISIAGTLNNSSDSTKTIGTLAEGYRPSANRTVKVITVTSANLILHRDATIFTNGMIQVYTQTHEQTLDMTCVFQLT